jgi:hypothetical protein
MREIQCKLGVSLARDECKLSGGGWRKCECVRRQKCFCGSCQIRVTRMHYIKSIRMFEDDVTCNVTCTSSINSIKEVHSGFLGWWSDVCNLKNFCIFGLFEYFDQGSSASFSCALAVNVIGLLFLRQCFMLLLPSTETLIIGTSRKLPLCIIVSQYVWWRMT